MAVKHHSDSPWTTTNSPGATSKGQKTTTDPQWAATAVLLTLLDGKAPLPPHPAQLSVLVLNALPIPPWHHLAQHPRISNLTLYNPFRPHFTTLERFGFQPTATLPDNHYDLILMVPGKYRKETLGLFAQAMAMLAPQGRIMVACHNDLGAATYQKRLFALTGPGNSISKSHCRIFWTPEQIHLDQELAHTWLAYLDPMVIPPGLQTVHGIYNAESIDRGSALLAQHLPDNLHGKGMDLGANYGYLAYMALTANSAQSTITHLHLVEADHRALECAKTNLSSLPGIPALHFHWCDVEEALPTDLDFILLNPPFHSGKSSDVRLGERFVEKACACLRPKGKLFLVANAFLPYERVMEHGLARVSRMVEEEGFKMLLGAK